MNRRNFLKTSAMAVAGAAYGATASEGAAAQRSSGPTKIIDTHTHFYDPTRPERVPWPPQADRLLYRRTMPEDYRKLAVPLGVTGTVVVEASSWLEDNQWILDLAEDEPLIVGFVGRLKPGEPGFRRHLARFAKNRFFRGIRIRGEELTELGGDRGVLPDLQRLADADLSLDLVGGAPISEHALQLARQTPKLRIVIDHLPFDMPEDPGLRRRAEEAIRGLAGQANVFAKVSHVLRRVDDRVPTEVEFYREKLDLLWRLFGPDRVVYGSNWPVCERIAPYPDVQRIVMDYVTTKGQEITEKYFWENSLAAYRWVERA